MNAQLHALEDNDPADISAAEKDLATEAMNLLHAKNVDTANLERAVQDAKSLSRLSNPTEVSSVIDRLRQEIRGILSHPGLQRSIWELQDYYRQIFSKPILANLNQEIYEKSLQFLISPQLEHDDQYLEELRSLFIVFLRAFLAEERALLSSE